MVNGYGAKTMLQLQLLTELGVAARLLAIEAKLLLCLSLDVVFFWETLDN